jgi:excisionase family DNA binding protein
MEERAQFIGFTKEELRLFIRVIVRECLIEFGMQEVGKQEVPLTIQEACDFLGVSAPTLKKFVDLSLIRRHDLGGRKKVFYRSELEEDIKRIAIPSKPPSSF